jgi:phage shock protein PspC (stress-responsive transcriptional regulator)
MDTHERPPTPPPAPLRRGSERLLGGVCTGIAARLGVDPVLVRIGAVVLGLVVGPLALLAYLAAWVMIPAPETEVPTTPLQPASTPSPTDSGPGPVHQPVDPKTAWNAVGDELRTLVGTLRTPSSTPGSVQPTGSPLQAVDRAATEAGRRLRTPEVRDSARRLATGLSTAVTTGVDGLSKRVKRSD